MNRICLGPGHSPPDFGAYSHGLSEFKEAVRVSVYTADLLRSMTYGVYEFYGDLRSKVDMVNSVEPEIAVEVHFNWFHDLTVGGSEVLYYPAQDKKGLNLASTIQEKLVEALGLKDRGTKPRKDLRFLNGTFCPAVIVEPLFLTCDGDVRWLLDGEHHTIADAIAVGIRTYLERLNGQG